MKLSEAIDEFLRFLRVERGLAENTLKAYESDLRRLQSHLHRDDRPELKLHQITPLHLKDHLATLRDDERFKPRSISRVMSTMRVFFDHLVREEFMPKSPALSLHNPKLPKKLPLYLVDEEIARLLLAPDRNNPEGYRDYAILVTFLFTGMRLSELVGLNVGDVDFSSNSILIHGKGSKERLVPMHSLVSRTLRAYLDEVRSPIDSDPQALFYSRTKTRITSRGVGYAVERAVKAAGVNHRITPHKLRHTFATQLLHRGASLLEIKELLGHSQIATTSIYTHTHVDRLRKAVEKIDS
ncbi:tyrosine-type recombinase/integrase [bacterium]|nr:tyrosine-type recombinase/integrase [bacterium]